MEHWKLHQTKGYRGGEIESADGKTHIATVYSHPGTDYAPLIVVAPEMLQKLEIMVEIFSHTDPDPLQAMVAIEQAKEVIERARC